MAILSGVNARMTLVESGKSLVFVSAKLEVDDGQEGALRGGVQDDYTEGPKKASGEVVVDSRTLIELVEEARMYGGWAKLPPQPIQFYIKAESGTDELNVECRVRFKTPNFDLNTESSDKLIHTIQIIPLYPIHLNGLPL